MATVCPNIVPCPHARTNKHCTVAGCPNNVFDCPADNPMPK